MKKKMTIAVLLTVLVLILAGSAVSGAGAQSDQILTVSGTGTVLLEPDLALITIGISTEKESVEEALDGNTQAVNAVKSALIALGVGEQDIKTSSYSLYSSQKYYRDNTASMDEYIFTVYYGFEIKLRDISKLNEVLDACIQNGANSINNVNFDSTLRSETYAQARDLAIEDAEKNAQQVAEKLGVELGTIANFKVRDYPTDIAYNYGMGGMGGGGGSAPLDSGSLKVIVMVDMGYLFNNK